MASEEKGCGICFEEGMTKRNSVALECHPAHRFHKKCIAGWFKQKRNCPLCRKSVRIPARLKGVKPPPAICCGVKKNGQPCSFKAKSNGYCGFHQGQERSQEEDDPFNPFTGERMQEDLERALIASLMMHERLQRMYGDVENVLIISLIEY